MTQLKGSLRNLRDGFEGEISGLGLSDLVQLAVQSNFAGCIRVQTDGGTGLIFLREGQVVHAEQGDRVGEEAFGEILRWSAGRFSLEPNVASTRSTIKKGWQHLLLEAHRFIDEERAGRRPRPEPVAREPAARPAAAPATSLIDRICQIPGVVSAVLQRSDGMPLGDDSARAEALAARALYLGMVGRQLGDAFEVGEVQSAVVEGGEERLLLLCSAGHYLSVVVGGDASVREVESEVRMLLGGGR